MGNPVNHHRQFHSNFCFSLIPCRPIPSMFLPGGFDDVEEVTQSPEQSYRLLVKPTEVVPTNKQAQQAQQVHQTHQTHLGDERKPMSKLTPQPTFSEPPPSGVDILSFSRMDLNHSLLQSDIPLTNNHGFLCTGCGTNQAVARVEPCGDELCRSCICASRCPACGVIIQRSIRL